MGAVYRESIQMSCSLNILSSPRGQVPSAGRGAQALLDPAGQPPQREEGLLGSSIELLFFTAQAG